MKIIKLIKKIKKKKINKKKINKMEKKIMNHKRK